MGQAGWLPIGFVCLASSFDRLSAKIGVFIVVLSASLVNLVRPTSDDGPVYHTERSLGHDAYRLFCNSSSKFRENPPITFSSYPVLRQTDKRRTKQCRSAAAMAEVTKSKGSPYSITERRAPELIPVLGSQPTGDVSHKPGGRLPLLSARPAVTLATLERAATNIAAW